MKTSGKESVTAKALWKNMLTMWQDLTWHF